MLGTKRKFEQLEHNSVSHIFAEGEIIDLYPRFLSEELAASVLEECKYPLESEHLNWADEHINMFGKQILCPRKTAFLGKEAGLRYRYSGKTMTSVQWSPLVAELANMIALQTGQLFNVCLLNYYRDGNDYLGFHSDDERDMPTGSIIASISLGETREFLFRRKANKKQQLLYLLMNGDLLIMGGTTQQLWQHSLPKAAKGTRKGARLNFTFRLVKEQYLKK